MNKYQVTRTQTLTVMIKAESAIEAKKKAMKLADDQYTEEEVTFETEDAS